MCDVDPAIRLESTFRIVTTIAPSVPHRSRRDHMATAVVTALR